MLPPKNIQVVSVDLETTGCNPKVESPVGKAKIWCMTAAWRDSLGNLQSCFLNLAEVSVWRDILEDTAVLKVGAGLWTYDYHVFANHGIQLRNIEDILDMSRWTNSATNYGHSLKHWCGRLGVEQESFKSLTTVRTEPLGGFIRKERTVLRAFKGQKTKAPVHYYPSEISKLTYKQLSIQDLWEKYPERRERIKRYAIQDAVGGLLAWEHLKQTLMETKR